MTTMAVSQGHVGCLVAYVVLGKSARPFVEEIDRLLTNNGLEWTCSRLKAIWTAANHLRKGDKQAAIAIYQANSISYHSWDGTPKGPIRPAVVGYVHARKMASVRRFASVLRFYTGLQLEGPITPRQRRKAEAAITGEGACPRSRARRMADEAINAAPKSLREFVLQRDGKEYIPPVEERYATGLKSTSYYYSPCKMPRSVKRPFWEDGKRVWKVPPYYHMCLSFLTTAWVPPSLDEITPCKELREQIKVAIRANDKGSAVAWDCDPDDAPVGKISALQEQGCKARVVCMPSAWLQLAFKPLHYILQGMAEEWFPAQSCQTDQVKGARAVQRLIANGQEVYCTDLSSATDRFPREFSIRVMERLGLENYARALEDVCEKEFLAPWGGTTKYAVGQPMGLYGSFPLFHLSHLLVAYQAEVTAKQYRLDLAEMIFRSGLSDHADPEPLVTFYDGTTFKIIGDDVVFSDQLVCAAYRSLMGRLGVEISAEKSFEGNLAEFAGFVVTETNQGATAFRPYKVPSGEIVSNPIDFLANLGSRACRRSSYWRRQFDRYSKTIGMRDLDLSPLVPDTEPYGPNPFEGDNQTLSSTSHVLRMVLDLPDIGDSSYESQHVNTIPMFPERRIGDRHGFNPQALLQREKSAKRADLPHGVRVAQAKLESDPLMREVRRVEQMSFAQEEVSQPLGTIDPEPIPLTQGDWSTGSDTTYNRDSQEIIDEAVAYALQACSPECTSGNTRGTYMDPPVDKPVETNAVTPGKGHQSVMIHDPIVGVFIGHREGDGIKTPIRSKPIRPATIVVLPEDPDNGSDLQL